MTSNQALTSLDRWTPHGRRGHHHPTEPVIPLRRTERKHATVLFVDVEGSMDLSAAIEPEEWWGVIAGLFELMCDGVCRFGGWVGNFTGDGIKGVFEAPDSAEVHARQACRAALWMRKALQRPRAELLREHGVELAVRIGINSGEVLTGTIGDQWHRRYVANGYAVALAKRIEGLALPGRVYLTEHTAALVADDLELHDLGAFQVRGAQSPVGVFELIA